MTKCTAESLSAAPATLQNQLPGFQYDLAGNMVVNGSATYTYDAENQIKTAGGVTYVYDGDGKRVNKSLGRLYWYGMGSDSLTETDGSGNLLREFVYFNGKRIARIDLPAGTVQTTLLNILANFIPEYERILVIEDTAEIQINTPNLVHFEARTAQNGLPAVSIRDLLKASLRHRPDRILLGEIRGAEAFDLLQLLNTGHSGTISTLHANSALQALNRFTSCVLQSNIELPYRAIKSNIADSVNVLVHIERRFGRRVVSEMLEISGFNSDDDHYQFKLLMSRKGN